MREEACLSRIELAEILSISPDGLGKIERGEREASRAALNMLSKTFGKTIDYILTGRDYTSNGMARNQSFVGMGELVDTPLAKDMFKTLHQFNNKFTGNILEVDRIGNELSNLKALEKSASSLSINDETSKILKEVEDELVPAP